MDIISYDYKPKAGLMALAAAFFGLCTAGLATTAHGNAAGLIIDGVISLNPGQATMFYRIVAAVSAVMTLGGVLGVYRAVTSQHKLILDDVALRVPKSGLSDRVAVISYHTITGLSVLEIRSRRFLTVTHAGGHIHIYEGMLPGHDAFERVGQALQQRVEAARSLYPNAAGPTIRD